MVVVRYDIERIYKELTGKSKPTPNESNSLILEDVGGIQMPKGVKVLYKPNLDPRLKNMDIVITFNENQLCVSADGYKQVGVQSNPQRVSLLWEVFLEKYEIV